MTEGERIHIDAYFPAIPLPPDDAKLLIDNLSEEQREEAFEEDVEGPEDVEDVDEGIDPEDDEWDELFAVVDELNHFESLRLARNGRCRRSRH